MHYTYNYKLTGVAYLLRKSFSERKNADATTTPRCGLPQIPYIPKRRMTVKLSKNPHPTRINGAKSP